MEMAQGKYGKKLLHEPPRQEYGYLSLSRGLLPSYCTWLGFFSYLPEYAVAVAVG
jgi:hypothetical protein